MKTKFGVGKRIYDGDCYDTMNTFTSDIPFYLELAKKEPVRFAVIDANQKPAVVYRSLRQVLTERLGL